MIKILKEVPTPVNLYLATESLVKQKPSEFTNILVPPFGFDNANSAAAAVAKYNELGKNLLQASAVGDINEVRVLLTNGCPFISDWLGVTPLHLAAQHDQYEVCEALLKSGITKDAKNKVDKTPLHMAVHEGHYEIVKLLLENEVDINCIDMLNMTPLHWAVQNEHIEIVELLLRHNAKTNILNKFDLSPLIIAQQVNNLDIIKILQGYIENTQEATDSLVVEMHSSEQNNELGTTNEHENDSLLEPVIIVDEADFISLQNSQTNVKNGETRNNESYLISIRDNGEKEENYTQAGTKDPVIINLPKDINEEMPQISEKSSSTALSNLKLIQSADEENDNNFSAMQLLQEHGITIIPNDGQDTSILNAVMENGHSVVLTDVGKEVLNTVKRQEANHRRPAPVNLSEPERKTVTTISPERFLSMISDQQKTPALVKVAPGSKPRPVKRITMKKNRLTPYGNDLKIRTTNSSAKPSLDLALKELADARKVIAEYKTKLELKELELERYKKRIHVVLVDPSK